MYRYIQNATPSKTMEVKLNQHRAMSRSFLSTLVTLGIIFSGISVANSAVNFGSTTLALKSGSTVLASATVTNMKAGYFSFGKVNYADGKFLYRDKKTSNTHKVYAEVISIYNYQYSVQMQGGIKLLRIGTGYGKEVQSKRTTGSASIEATLSSTWKPTPFTKAGGLYSVCEDRKLRPDKCKTVSKMSYAKHF